MQHTLTKNRAFFLICLFVTLFALSLSAQTPQITPTVQDFLLKAGKDQTIKVWVFFNDKGHLENGILQKALSRPDAFLTPRSIKRRKKVRPSHRIVDAADLPVSSEYIAKLLQTGARPRIVTRWFNGLSVEATPEQIRTIASFPFVRKIRPVLHYQRREVKREENLEMGMIPDEIYPFEISSEHPLPQKKTEIISPYSNITSLNYGASLHQLEQINVPALHDLGYDGKGVLVCMMDTGFRKSHRAFRHLNVVAERDFVMGDDDTQWDRTDSLDYTDAHGTATWSTLSGYIEGKLIGPAFGADFLLAKTEHHFEEFPTEEDYWVAGVEWADSLGTDVISSSLGYFYWYSFSDMDGETALTTQAADRAAGLGIVVVVAAGNERGTDWGHIIAPADGDSVIAVGAVGQDGTIAFFSSPGPTFDGRIKPEVCALGRSTVSAHNADDLTVSSFSGTSLATPLVAGAAALLLQIHPEWSAMDVREALLYTASQHDSPDNDYGWGIVHALKASGMAVPYLSLVDYIIDDSQGNGDSKIDPGETVKLSLMLLNRGTSEAPGVTARLTVESSYIMLIDSSISVGTIWSDNTVLTTEPFTIKAAGEVPEGTVVQFELTLSDSEGRGWQTAFDLMLNVSQWHVSWSTPEVIYSPIDAFSNMASCADYSGMVHVLWAENRTEEGRIYYVHQSSEGCQAPEILYSTTKGLYDFMTPYILPFSNGLYAIWSVLTSQPDEEHGADFSAYMSICDSTGWSAPEAILEDPGWQLIDFPEFALDTEDCLHVFVSYFKATAFYHCMLGSSGWIRNPIGTNGVVPSMVSGPSGVLYLTFLWGGSSHNLDVFYTFSQDNGESWSVPVEVYGGPYDSQRPQIAVAPDNTLHIVWKDNPSWTGPGERLLYHSFSRDGVHWSDPATISSPTDQLIYFDPQLYSDRDGDLHLVWSEGVRYDWFEIYYAQWSDGTWSQKVCLTSDFPRKFKWNPSLSLDYSGRLHLVYTSGDELSSPFDICHLVSEPVCGPDTTENNPPDTTSTNIPKSFALFQNFPNPFNSETTIRYQVTEESRVSLTIYNILGEEVKRLVDEKKPAGTHSMRWDGRDRYGKKVSSGIYIYRTEAVGLSGRFVQTRKMILMK